MLYQEWLKIWLDNYVQPSSKQRTYFRYSEILHDHLIPKFGDYEMSDIRVYDIQCYVTYTGTDKDVVIFTYLDGKKVTSIDANLFAGNTTITSVTFGEGITFIPDGAFEGCTSLKSVVFNGEIKSIGAKAFKGCSSLEFEIPDTVESIGNSAFDGCESMDSATISTKAKSLGIAVFNNCGDLELMVNNNDLSLIQKYLFSQTH